MYLSYTLILIMVWFHWASLPELITHSIQYLWLHQMRPSMFQKHLSAVLHLKYTPCLFLMLDCQNSNMRGKSRSQFSNHHPIQCFANPAGSRDHAGNMIPGSEGVIWPCMVQRQTHRLLMAWGLYCKRCPPDTLAAGETQIDFLQESTESLSGGGPL